MTKLKTAEIDIISLYRSQGANDREIIDDLQSAMDMNKVTIIAGDFNSCFVDQRDNSITQFLEDIGFSQHVSEATHLMGGHIDHVYSNQNRNVYDVTVLMYSPYYTSQDHDAVFIIIKKTSV